MDRLNQEWHAMFDGRFEIDPDKCCFLWILSRTQKGYGQYRLYGREYPENGKLVRTHRLSWILANGPIPDGLHVCHKCDNPPCCNPDHLFVATNYENRLDSARKGRTNKITHWASTGPPTQKLNWEKVYEIRKLLADGGKDLSIAEKFGVTKNTIGFIRKNRTWVIKEAA